MHALLWLALLCRPAAAHNPTLATFALDRDGAAWALTGSFSEGGAEAALRADHPDAIQPGMPMEALDAMIRAEILDHLSVTADGRPAPARITALDLGPHQTDVRLSLDAPADAARWEIRLSAFAANPGQTHLLRLPAPEGAPRPRLLLRADNSFTARFDLKPPATRLAALPAPAWLLALLPLSLLAARALRGDQRSASAG